MKLLRLLAPCLVACLPSIVQAGDCGWAMATLYGYGGGWNNRPVVVNNFTPPYFAMHPPVYYGARYYRPYGDSPFASWPQLQANPAYMPQQQAMNKSVMSIENPHYAAAIQVVPQYAPTAFPEVHPDVPAQPIQPAQPMQPDHNIQPAQPMQPMQPVHPALPMPQTQPAQPAQPAKVPDVVKGNAKARGPVTIENPYFRESAQFIKKGDKADTSDKH